MLKHLRTLIIAAALAAAATVNTAPAAASLAQLRGVAELKSWFNAYKGKPRLILLLSPT